MAAPDAPAVPLDRAVEEARTYLDHIKDCDGGWCCINGYGSAMSNLLAALDADKRLEGAEDLLRSARRYHDAQSPMGYAIDCYFARREEKGENRG